MRFTLNYSKGGKREIICSSQGWKGKEVKEVIDDKSNLEWGVILKYMAWYM